MPDKITFKHQATSISAKTKTGPSADLMKKLTWEEIRGLTPLLFVHDENVAPPNFVRRLWAAISAYKLNEYETDVERSDALSVLMTLAMIFQEFRSLVFHQSLLKPQSMVNYLGIPDDHIKQILYDNLVTTETDGASIEEILTLDSMNRDCVYDAIVDYFPKRDLKWPDSFDRDSVFRLFAFPIGLSREEMQMPLSELIEKKVFEAGLDGTLKMVANFEWKRGFEFIDSRFARTVSYT